MFGYFEIESLHHALATLLQLINVIFFVKMQQDTNTIT